MCRRGEVASAEDRDRNAPHSPGIATASSGTGSPSDSAGTANSVAAAERECESSRSSTMFRTSFSGCRRGHQDPSQEFRPVPSEPDQCSGCQDRQAPSKAWETVWHRAAGGCRRSHPVRGMMPFRRRTDPIGEWSVRVLRNPCRWAATESSHKGMSQAGAAPARCTDHPDWNTLSQNQCGSPGNHVGSRASGCRASDLFATVGPAPYAPVRGES